MKNTNESIEAKLIRLIEAHASCEGYTATGIDGPAPFLCQVAAQGYAPGPGLTPARLDNVQLLRVSHPLPRHPIIYNPCIVMVFQGRKIGYLGENTYTYDKDNYLLLSVPMPFECETPDATPEKPMLSLAVGVDQAILGELLMEMNDLTPQTETVPGISTSRLTPELKNAAARLLDCLDDPMESRILGRQIVREIIYRVLNGPQGGALRALAGLSGSFGQVGRALRLIHANFEQDLDVETLARAASMSVSGFHQTFKTVTATTPIQYVKSIRLHKARMFMVQDGLNASSAAVKVGYASPSQFSREFKRFFGLSPVDEVRRLKAGEPPAQATEGLASSGA